MMRSMYSGVAGMRAHQVWMDVIGNNIANVNTVGFKSGQVSFQDALCQTVRGAAALIEGGLGGVNPLQIGLGVKMGTVTNNFAQGSLMMTGRMLDLSMQGEGFFILSSGVTQYYSRAGSLGFDADGYMVNPANGLRVQGWLADANGNIDTEAQVEDVHVNMNATMQPKATERFEFRGNINATLAVGGTAAASMDVRDSLGNNHTVEITFTKTGENAWSWAATQPAGAIGNGTLTFNTEGLLDGFTPAPPMVGFDPGGGAAVLNIELDLGWSPGDPPSPNALTQYAKATSAAGIYQDGYPSGELQGVTISEDGIISGFFSNGKNRPLAQIAVASFNNPGGLLKEGGNTYVGTINSGLPNIGTFGTGNRGTVTVGALEMSNVDLAQEFSNLISAQRGFQANTRIIATVDQVMTDVVALKR